MTKLTLTDVKNLQNESTVVTTLKQNNDATEAALDNTLSRDGTTPNQMLSNLDMNNYKIINLPDATTDQEPATYSQLNASIAAVDVGAVLQGSYITAVEENTLVNNRVLTGSSNISISDNGPNSAIVIDATNNVTKYSEVGTLQNKTLDNTNVITVEDVNFTLQDNTDNTKQAKFDLTNIATGTTKTYVLPNINDAITTNNAGQTLTNKTLDNSNNITLKDTSFILQDDVDTTKVVKFNAGTQSTGTTVTYNFPGANSTDTLVSAGAGQTLTNKTLNDTNTATFKDTNFTLEDNTDTTKKAIFELSGITTGTTRTYTLPNASDTVTVNAGLQTLTNKTLDTAGPNTIKVNGTSLTAVTGSGSVVLATSPTLTTPTLGVATATSVNKVTLTQPATGSTLTVADGKTLSSNNTLTFSGTDNSTLNVGVGGTLTGSSSSAVFYDTIPQNSQSAAYTLVLSDAEKHILHPVGDNNARTFTIPSNASVAYPIGTAITFVNKINTVTIAITTDTLTLAVTGSTGSRTLAANGIATALKITSTEWIISGSGLS